MLGLRKRKNNTLNETLDTEMYNIMCTIKSSETMDDLLRIHSEIDEFKEKYFGWSNRKKKKYWGVYHRAMNFYSFAIMNAELKIQQCPIDEMVLKMN